MEMTTLNSSHEEIAEAMRGCWGRDVTKESTIVYVGQLIVGQAETTEILDKQVKVKHKDWIPVGENLYISFLN